MDFDINSINFIFSLEDEVVLSTYSASSMYISEHLGLPVIFNLVNEELQYNIQGLDYKKPKKINFGNSYQIKISSYNTLNMITINGKRTIPQIFFDDYHVGGYVELRALEKENKLKDLLK